MGARDSSLTRAAPVFDQLWAMDRTGKSWLPGLLGLPSGAAAVPAQGADGGLTDLGWGSREKKLDPPVALLSWLLRHPPANPPAGLSRDPAKAELRRQWLSGSALVLREALKALLYEPLPENAWYVFEGQTQPDVYLETPELIVVIEGKRTEPQATTKTKWMPGRHQMLRHLDCAWEIRGRKQVVGFFIVEADDDTGTAPPEWLAVAKDTVSASALASSLPHRGPEEQAEIAACFAGVTTWQRVCGEFELDCARLPDTVG